MTDGAEEKRKSQKRSRKEQAADRMVEHAGVGWLSFLGAIERLQRDGVEVHRLTIKGTWGGDDEMLLVLAARTENEGIVAFHNASELPGLWQGVANRIRNGSLKWKEDQYAD